MSLWRCSICGYVAEGEHAPDICPKCKQGSDKFIQMSEEEANLLYRSDKTNGIHFEMITLANKMIALADEGIEDALDPMCVGVFHTTKQLAWEIKGLANAELKGHASKGKF